MHDSDWYDEFLLGQEFTEAEQWRRQQETQRFLNEQRLELLRNQLIAHNPALYSRLAHLDLQAFQAYVNGLK